MADTLWLCYVIVPKLYLIKMASNYKYFLDAGFVDDLEEVDFDEDFDNAINEVAASGVIYNCTECKKTYKTLGGYNAITKQNTGKTKEKKNG